MSPKLLKMLLFTIPTGTITWTKGNGIVIFSFNAGIFSGTVEISEEKLQNLLNGSK